MNKDIKNSLTGTKLNAETLNCFDCGALKPLDDFYWNKTRGQYEHYCTKCSNIRTNRSRQKTKSGLASSKAWKDRNKVRRADYQRQYRAKKAGL